MSERPAGNENIAYRIGARRKSVAMSSLCAALLAALPTGAATTAPTTIAIFDFEFEDFSAGASSAGASPSDTEQLMRVTDEVRQLLARSGRYHLVDVGTADAAAVRERTLRRCDGCDAAIALNLGAEQSFVGVVRRITRTEYVVRFQIRDARTGAVVSDENSGLNMGADYSWHRGAARLIKDRLLEIREQR
ncbi:MAG TPA: DUF2380 domain-containing protein [Azospirillum sp.]|nr:DUF2380 domain-containing protein [Azospirillum sp.]